MPGAINPNACANLQITFTGPAAPGASNAVYTAGSDDTTAQLAAGHNRRVNLSASARKLEVMLLLDYSGSMNAKPNGQPIVAATDSRLSKAVTAANQFLDLLAAFGVGAGRFGVARFPDPVTCPTSADIQTATNISVASDRRRQDRAGGQCAREHDADRPRHRPHDRNDGGLVRLLRVRRRVATVQPALARPHVRRRPQLPPRRCLRHFFGAGATSFQGKKIAVITVGFGDPGASVYAPDHTLLTNIESASGSAGLFLDAGADDLGMGLAKSFRTAITAGLSLDPTTDPHEVLTSGRREIRNSIPISKYESKAAFVVNWGTFDPNRVQIEVLTPNCELITPSVAQADPNIEFAGDPRYTIYTFNNNFLRNSAAPKKPRYGDWTLIVSAPSLRGAAREEFEYEVIFESRLKMTLSFDRTRYFAGDPIVLTARLTLDGQPVTGATVSCQLDAPGQFVNNWLAALKVTPDEMTAARATLLEDANALTVKTAALQRRGEVFLKFPSVRTVAMTDPDNDGVYQATFSQTTTPGTFDFQVTAVGATAEGIPFGARSARRFRSTCDLPPSSRSGKPCTTDWSSGTESSSTPRCASPRATASATSISSTPRS